MGHRGTVDRSDPAYAGQALYTPMRLKAYDVFVYRFNMPVLWRCPKRRLGGLYDEHVSGRHLDIGVATGALLDRCRFPVETPALTLMDLNPHSLEFAAERLRRYEPRTHQANVLEDWGLPPASFDSIGMMNLLHCLPGTIESKAVAFDQARSALAPGGTLFGSTVLGKGVRHTRRSSWMMRTANREGSFCNTDDSLEALDASLGERFPWHQVEVEGTMALFVAHAPA